MADDAIVDAEGCTAARMPGRVVVRADFEVVGKHIANLKGKYDEADKRLDKFGDKLHSLGGTEPVLEESAKLPL